jgi:DNA-binding transcriptional LysR family regulator
MLPTEAGKRLYTKVVDAVEKLEAVPTRNMSDTAPLLIRLGTPQEFFMERVLQQLSPEVFYTVRFGLAQDLIDQLLEGQLDVVVATQRSCSRPVESGIMEESVSNGFLS